MSSYITRTFSDGSDIGLQLGHEEFIGQLTIGNNWNKLRIGWLWNIGDNAANTPGGGLSGIAVGMCSGIAHPYGDSATTNFVGIVSQQAWLYNAFSGFPAYSFVAPNIVQAATKIGAAITTNGDFADNSGMYVNSDAGPARRGLNFMEITKGSPNYTVNFWWGGSDGGAAWAHIDWTRADLENLMFMTPPAGQSVTFDSFGPFTIAASESPGPLDTVDIYINQLANPCTLWEVRVVKFS